MSFPTLFRVWLFVFFFSSSLLGQSPSGYRYLATEIANDVFYLPLKTDRYFTSGMQVEWGSVRFRRIARAGNQPVMEKRYWKINQDLFTPNAIDSLQIMPGDRPFASYLTLSRGHVTELSGFGFQLRRQWTVGVLGKYSFGGKMQNAFHSMIDFAEEIPGWVNEVNPDVVLNYEIEIGRRFPLGKWHRFHLNTRGRLGTLYTDIRPEGVLSLVPVRFGENAHFGISAAASTRLVGYNATLSGGLINRDERYRPNVVPIRTVHQLGLTSGLYLNGYKLEGGVRWLSPEFEGGEDHLWAWFGVSIR